MEYTCVEGVGRLGDGRVDRDWEDGGQADDGQAAETEAEPGVVTIPVLNIRLGWSSSPGSERSYFANISTLP